MAAASPYRIPGERATWAEPPPVVMLAPPAAVPAKANGRAINPELDGVSCAVEQDSWLGLDEPLGLQGRVEPCVPPVWTANDTRWMAVVVSIGIALFSVLYVLAFSYR